MRVRSELVRSAAYLGQKPPLRTRDFTLMPDVFFMATSPVTRRFAGQMQYLPARRIWQAKFMTVANFLAIAPPEASQPLVFPAYNIRTTATANTTTRDRQSFDRPSTD